MVIGDFSTADKILRRGMDAIPTPARTQAPPTARTTASHDVANVTAETKEGAESNLASCRATVEALRSAGQLGERDQAAVALALAMAHALDKAPFNAGIAREYREALRFLAGPAVASGPNPTEQAWALLREATAEQEKRPQ